MPWSMFELYYEMFCLIADATRSLLSYVSPPQFAPPPDPTLYTLIDIISDYLATIPRNIYFYCVLVQTEIITSIKWNP